MHNRSILQASKQSRLQLLILYYCTILLITKWCIVGRKKDQNGTTNLHTMHKILHPFSFWQCHILEIYMDHPQYTLLASILIMYSIRTLQKNPGGTRTYWCTRVNKKCVKSGPFCSRICKTRTKFRDLEYNFSNSSDSELFRGSSLRKKSYKILV